MSKKTLLANSENVSYQNEDTDQISNTENDKLFYTNNLVVAKMINENDLDDFKRFLSIRHYMYIISIISNLTSSLSLSANIIINIVQNIIDSKEKLIIYQIISLSIFIFSLGLNYFSNNVDISVKNQQLKLMMKFGVNSNNYNDQDAIVFDQSAAIQNIKSK
jgi:hypothetical protein